VVVAKKLIGLAIDLEKKKRFRTALCIFRRAYQVLPTENSKLVDRMNILEAACPDAAASVPSQQMATADYMQIVMDQDLLEVLNTGSYDELLTLPLIGDKRAVKIIDARPFRQVSCASNCRCCCVWTSIELMCMLVCMLTTGSSRSCCQCKESRRACCTNCACSTRHGSRSCEYRAKDTFEARV
jgi:hypothetical protein